MHGWERRTLPEIQALIWLLGEDLGPRRRGRTLPSRSAPAAQRRAGSSWPEPSRAPPPPRDVAPLCRSQLATRCVQEEEVPDKEVEPEFGLSGALAAETNKVK